MEALKLMSEEQFMQEFANKLKSLREAKGLSQKEVAYGAKVAIRALGDWENGKSIPTGSSMLRLALFLGIEEVVLKMKRKVKK